MTVLRGDKELSFALATRSLGQLQGEDFECAHWGFTVRDITRQMQLTNQLRDSLGVFVTGVKQVGPSDLGGLNQGDVVRAINRETVDRLADFTGRYHALLEQKVEKVLLTVKRNGATRLVVLNFEKQGTGQTND